MGQATFPVARASQASREKFISRTYNHLFAAIAYFTLLEVALFNINVTLSTGAVTSLAAVIAGAMMSVSWLLVIGGFVLASVLFGSLARKPGSIGMQYVGLFGFATAEAVVFLPLLFMANSVAPGAIASAAIVTLIGFGALTAIVFVTKKDFSFLRKFLMFASILSLVVIVASVIFSWPLMGVAFSGAMVLLSGGWILYQTSSIMRDYPEQYYVSAALALFTSVAMMFYYVLMFFMASRD
jgi:uncharacterized protein